MQKKIEYILTFYLKKKKYSQNINEIEKHLNNMISEERNFNNNLEILKNVNQQYYKKVKWEVSLIKITF